MKGGRGVADLLENMREKKSYKQRAEISVGNSESCVTLFLLENKGAAYG